MKDKLLSDIGGRREWAIVLDPGDEAMESLKVLQKENLTACDFTAIGAFASITVAWFDLDAEIPPD